jgi:hypothetical protein
VPIVRWQKPRRAKFHGRRDFSALRSEMQLENRDARLMLVELQPVNFAKTTGVRA